MSSIENALALKLRERLEGQKQEKEKTSQEQADKRAEELRHNFRQVAEIIEGLREISATRPESVKTGHGHRTSLSAHEEVLQKQLNNPDSEFQQLLRDSGINSIETLAATFPDSDESKGRAEAAANLEENRTRLRTGAPARAKAKHEALEFLQSTRQADQDGEISLVSEDSTVKVGNKKPARTYSAKARNLKAGAGLPAVESQIKELSGKPKITFESLIAALENQQTVFRAEYDSVFPNSTEGRRQGESLKKVNGDAESLFRYGKNEVLSVSERLDLVTSHFGEAERLAGRDKAKETLIAGLKERVVEAALNNMAASENLGGDITEVKKQLDFFSTEFSKKVEEARKEQQNLVNTLRGVTEKINEIRRAPGNREFDSQLDHESEHGRGQKPPFYNYRLNGFLSSVARELGLAQYETLVSGYSDYNLPYEKKPALSKLSEERDALNSFDRPKLSLFPRRETNPRYSSAASDMVPTGISDPEYLKQQLERWQQLLAAFNQAFEGEADKKSFLSSRDDYTVPGKIKAKLPREIIQSRLDPEINNHHLEIPAAVYGVFSGLGIGDIRQKVKSVESRAGKRTEKIMTGLGLQLDAQLAERDKRQLENGPQTAQILREGRQIQKDSKLAENLVGNKSWGQGSLASVENSLANFNNRPAIVEIMDGSPRLQDGQAVENKREAEKTIDAFEKRYNSLDDLRTERFALERQIQAFDNKPKLLRIDIGGKIAAGREAVEKMKADADAWEKANAKLWQANQDLRQTGRLGELLESTLFEDRDNRGGKQALKFSTEQLEVISKSKTIAEFMQKLREQLVAVRDTQLTPDQADVIREYQALQQETTRLQYVLETQRDVIHGRKGYALD